MILTTGNEIRLHAQVNVKIILHDFDTVSDPIIDTDSDPITDTGSDLITDSGSDPITDTGSEPIIDTGRDIITGDYPRCWCGD